MTDKKAKDRGKNKAGDGESSGSKENTSHQMPGFAGNIYQSKWLMWYLLKGWSSKQYTFEIGTEIKDAGKYDDLVFKYEKVDDKNEGERFIIMQSKHSTNLKNKITYQDVFTDKDVNYGLVKYYNSFVESKNAEMFKGREIEHAIIYTNARFDMDGKIPEKDHNWKELKNFRNITEEMKLENDILSVFEIKGGKFYQFKSDKVLPVLKSMILEYEYCKIARKLIECLKNKNKYLSLEDKTLERYNHLLLTEVIDKKTKKFHVNFLSESYDNVENITGLKKLRKVLDKYLNDEGLKIEEFANYVFKWRRDFEKSGQTTQFCPADIDDADLKEFLKKSVFATEQPDEIKLGKGILIELREQFSKYDTDFIFGHFNTVIQDWMKGEHASNEKSNDIFKNKFISFDDVNKFFINTIVRFNKIILKGPIADYDRHIQEYKINFFDLEFGSAVKTFLDSDQRILSITSEHIIISSIKLYKEIMKTVELEEFIYLKLSSPNNDSLNYVIETFESESTFRLLVIEWDYDETKLNDWMNKITDIIVQITNKKKLIIVSNRDDILEKYFLRDFDVDIECVKIQDIANTLENLEKDSQDCILNTIIKFQGTDAKLRDFITNDGLKKAIDGDVLQKILKKEDVNIGKPLEGLEGDIQNFYIDRMLMRKVVNGENVYFIRLYEEDLCSENQNFEIIKTFKLTTQNEIDTFKRVVDENNSKNVYLLRRKSNSLTLLKKSKDAFEESDFRNAMTCEPNKCQINLISAVAGTGKSTLFAKLSQKIKDKNPELWVVKIDLNTVSSKLNEIKNNKQGIQFDTVIDLLHQGAKHHNELEKTIFKYRLKSKNIELLLDGFDEICPSYKSIVLKMIQILENKIKTIWISTRPYNSIMKDMEETFANFYVKHYYFEPLTEDSQKQYLKNIWQEFIKVDENLFKPFVEELFKLLNDNMKGDFLGVPLHIMLIGISFKYTFVEFQNTGTSEISTEQRKKLLEMVDLSILYDKFVEFKCEIHCKDKLDLNLDTEAGKNILSESYKNCMKKSKILALNSVLDENESKILLTETELIELKGYKDEIEKKGDPFGIANQIVDDKPQFIHRTFAEYFVAMFFIENFKRKEKESQKYIEYFLENMINDENSVICEFIDSKLNDESNFIEDSEKYGSVVKNMDGEKLYFVLERSLQNIGEFLIKNGINVKYELNGKTILHPASKLERLKDKKPILSLILEKMNYEKNELKRELQKIEGYFDDTPLLVAARSGIFDNVKIIFEKCKTMEILYDILTDVNKNNDNIIHVAIHCDDTFFSNMIHLFKNESSIMKTLLKKKNKDNLIPFENAIIYGQQNKTEAIQNLTVESNFVSSKIFDKIDYDNDINFALKNLCNDDFFTYLSNLLKSDAGKLKDLLTKKSKSYTPFHTAVLLDQRNKFEILLNICGKLDISTDIILFNENEDSQNIIHLAAFVNCNNYFLTYLLDLLKSDQNKLKALLTKKDNKGYTPLDYTVILNCRNKFEILLNLCGELDISIDSVL